MDTGNKGHLDEADFRYFFGLFDVHPTAIELKRLIIRYLLDNQYF